MNEYDYNNDSDIEFHELVDLMKLRFQQSDSESELRHAFRVFDSEERGWVSCAEVKYVMMHLDDKLTDDETDAMLSEVVAIGDNERLEYEQFAELINLREKKKRKGKSKVEVINEVDEIEPRVWFADV